MLTASPRSVSKLADHEKSHIKILGKLIEQEPWRLPSRQAEFDGTDRLDAHSDDQAVTGNQGYFEDRELKLN